MRQQAGENRYSPRVCNLWFCRKELYTSMQPSPIQPVKTVVVGLPLSTSNPWWARATLHLSPSHDIFSTFVSQGCPPLAGCTRMLRVLSLYPGPQEALQSVHAPQSSLNRQLITDMYMYQQYSLSDRDTTAIQFNSIQSSDFIFKLQ